MGARLIEGCRQQDSLVGQNRVWVFTLAGHVLEADLANKIGQKLMLVGESNGTMWLGYKGSRKHVCRYQIKLLHILLTTCLTNHAPSFDANRLLRVCISLVGWRFRSSHTFCHGEMYLIVTSTFNAAEIGA